MIAEVNLKLKISIDEDVPQNELEEIYEDGYEGTKNWQQRLENYIVGFIANEGLLGSDHPFYSANDELVKIEVKNWKDENVLDFDERFNLAVEELGKVIDAGNKLAEVVHNIQSNYDGIHRSRLALANWYQVRADEFGRNKNKEQDK